MDVIYDAFEPRLADDIIKNVQEYIGKIKLNKDQLSDGKQFKKILKDRNLFNLRDIVNEILNKPSVDAVHKDKATKVYLRWLDTLNMVVDEGDKSLYKIVWEMLFNSYIIALRCDDAECREKLKYKHIKLAEVLKTKGINLLRVLIEQERFVVYFNNYSEEIKDFLGGGEKRQYAISDKKVETYIEKNMMNNCFYCGDDMVGYLDVLLEFFEKKDSYPMPNLQKAIIETDKVELWERAVKKNIFNGENRDELLEYALRKKYIKVIKEIILL